jgi:hypothetical protein
MGRLGGIIVVVAFLFQAAQRVEAAPDDWVRIDSVPKDADNIVVTIPIFSQIVSHRLPKGWKAGFENATKEQYMIEFVPEGQTVHDWKEMITVVGFKGLAARYPALTPREVNVRTATAGSKTCGDKIIAKSMSDAKVDSYEAHAAIIGCSGTPQRELAVGKKDESELAYHLAIKGKNDYYVIQYAIKGKPFPGPVDPALFIERMKSLEPIVFCDASLSPVACGDLKSRPKQERVSLKKVEQGGPQ